MATTTTKAAPAAKQCTDTESHLFGAVAVKGDSGRWGVMHPTNGGHWADDGDVADWADLKA